MGERQGNKRSAIIFGARNLGRAVIETLVADGWAVAGVARSQATLDGVREAGALALEADVTDPASVHAALEEAASAHGGIDLAVNAASAYGGDRSGPFGGGPIVEADPGAFDAWAAAPARAAFSFLSASGRFALAQGRAATLIQVTGGSARRAMPSRGLWAAGSFGVKAITNAAALELRPQRMPSSKRSSRSSPSRAAGRLPGRQSWYVDREDACPATERVDSSRQAGVWRPEQ